MVVASRRPRIRVLSRVLNIPQARASIQTGFTNPCVGTGHRAGRASRSVGTTSGAMIATVSVRPSKGTDPPPSPSQAEKIIAITLHQARCPSQFWLSNLATPLAPDDFRIDQTSMSVSFKGTPTADESSVPEVQCLDHRGEIVGVAVHPLDRHSPPDRLFPDGAGHRTSGPRRGAWETHVDRNDAGRAIGSSKALKLDGTRKAACRPRAAAGLRRLALLHFRRRIHTDACAGSTARLTTSSSSLRTVSRATPSRRRAAKLATVASES
jgi:hypothetical protein